MNTNHSRPSLWIGWHRLTGAHRWRPVARELTEAAAFASALAGTLVGDVCALPEGRLPMPRARTTSCTRREP
jgi:hypothetical protein